MLSIIEEFLNCAIHMDTSMVLTHVKCWYIFFVLLLNFVVIVYSYIYYATKQNVFDVQYVALALSLTTTNWEISNR